MKKLDNKKLLKGLKKKLLEGFLHFITYLWFIKIKMLYLLTSKRKIIFDDPCQKKKFFLKGQYI